MKKTIGLKKAVLATVGAVTSIMLISVILIGYLVSSNKIKSTLIDETEQSLLVCAEQMDAWLEEQGMFAAAQANAAGNLYALVPNHSLDIAFGRTVAPLNSALLDCYTSYEDKTIFLGVSDNSALPEGFDPTSRSWYQSAKAANRSTYSAPFVDASSGGIIFTVASPIHSNGQFVGVYGCDFKLDVLTNLASGMKITANGYPVLLDGDGNFLVHKNPAFMPTKDGVLTSYKEAKGDYGTVLSSLGASVSFGQFKDYDGASRYYAFKKLENAGWTVGYVMPKGDIDGALNALAVTYLVLFIAFFLLGTGAVFLVLNRRLKPLGRLAETAGEIANGNLSARLEYNSNDEIGTLCGEFEKCIDAMRTYTDDISHVLTAVAAGDLTVSPTVVYKGDFVKIEQSLRLILNELGGVMQGINSDSVQVFNSSVQMAEGSQSLAEGATRQASAIEQISATIQEVSEQIAATADNATQAGALSERTQDKVNYQDSEIQNMVRAMNEINETSKEIEKIIKTIEDIAFQTNILALNAAVEAARAGSAGKGFAVVADEVRNLATKSQDAAKSTSTLINAAIAAVGKGSELAASTAESMKEVKDMSAQTAKYIVDIASATQEQSDSIKQITEGIDQISQVIQTNAATAEETSALCSSLNGQSKQLQDQVAHFKTGQSGRGF